MPSTFVAHDSGKPRTFGPLRLLAAGCGSKIGTSDGTLVSGNMDQDLPSPGDLILTHTHPDLGSQKVTGELLDNHKCLLLLRQRVANLRAGKYKAPGKHVQPPIGNLVPR